MATRETSVASSRPRFALTALVMGAVAMIAIAASSSRPHVDAPAAMKAAPPVVLGQGTTVKSTPESVAARDRAAKMIAGMPVYFEENRGQTDPSVRYLSRNGRYSLFITDEAAIISQVGGLIHKGPLASVVNSNQPKQPDRLVEAAVKIRMVGANPHPKITAMAPLPGKVNYLIGDDPSKYHTDVPTYERVKVAGVYPGVDLVYYGAPGTLEYDIVAAPGADISKIKLAIDGPAETAMDKDGNLAIRTAAGQIAMHKPIVYQEKADGSRTTIDGAFKLAAGRTIKHGVLSRALSFEVAQYDHSRAVVIDPPIIVYSTYFGGHASSIGPVNLAQFGGVTGGEALTVADLATDVALDSTNKAYITGVVYSNDFPNKNAFQGFLNGAHNPPAQNPNTFVAKFDTTLSNNASLIFSTYLGGSGATFAGSFGKGDGDLGFGIAVDASGQPYVVGQTYSVNFPGHTLCGSFGNTNPQGGNIPNVGFISKLNNTGTGVVFSCYIRGASNATESRIVLFPAGCGTTTCKAYMAGSTQSTPAEGFPVTGNAFQSVLRATSAKSNASFIVVHEDGQSLDYATYYGGSGNGTNADSGIGVAVDSSGKGYITGATFSNDLTLVNPAVSTYQGGGNNPPTSNVFVAEFDPTKSGVPSLVYATLLGGTGATGTIGSPFNVVLTVGDLGTGLVVDSNDDIWVTGLTASLNFQVPGSVGTPFQSFNEAGSRHDCVPSTPNPPATAAFVTQLDPSQPAGLTQVRYSTYFGGCGQLLSGAPFATGSIGIGDVSTDIRVVGGKVFITGATTSGKNATHDFPLSANALACSSAFRLDDNQSSGIDFGGFVQVPITSFVSEIDPTTGTSGLVFSALLGGSGMADIAGGLKVDSSGNIVVAGLTYSTDFPITPSTFQFANNAANQGSSNGFLTVLDPTGNQCPTPFTTPSPTVSATPTITTTPTATSTSATSTATATSSATATATHTATATATATGSATHTPTATATNTATATATHTATATATGSATHTPTATATSSPTASATHTATATATGSATATATRTATPTATATSTSTSSATRTATPTATATATTTATATATATATRTATPTATPTAVAGLGKLVVQPKNVKFNSKNLAVVPKTLTIKNNGKGTLNGNVGNPLLGPPFTESNGGAFSLPPKGTKTVNLNFSPAAPGSFLDSLSVTSDDPKHTSVTVNLKGKAKAPK